LSTLSDPAVRALCRDRIQRLNPNANAKWGRMSAPQMVCHLNDSFRAGMGEKYASPSAGLLQRTLVKWIALHTPFRWPSGVPTRPEIEQGRGGTPPGEWDCDRAELLRLLDAFASRPDSGQHPAFAAHPTFGKLDDREWLIWSYRHVDHHLRQFGV
jgi:hypothetical protein